MQLLYLNSCRVPRESEISFVVPLRVIIIAVTGNKSSNFLLACKICSNFWKDEFLGPTNWSPPLGVGYSMHNNFGIELGVLKAEVCTFKPERDYQISA